MASALDITDAMIGVLKDHTWSTVQPEQVISGPIPPGWLDYPCIGVVAGELEANTMHTTNRYADVDRAFLWDAAMILRPDNIEVQWRQLMEWEDEMVQLARAAKDRYWGMNGVQQIRSSRLAGLEPSVVMPDRDSDMPSLLAVTLRLEVGYRELIA